MIVFLPYYVAALALVYFELRGRSIVPPLAVPAWPAAVWTALLAAGYAVQLGIVWYAATTIGHSVPWRRELPIGVAEHGMAHPDAIEAALLVVAALQTYSLLGLYRARAAPGAIAAGFALLIALSIAAPATISPDVYAYAGDALMGRSAYHPPAAPFSGEYAVIDRLFHPRLAAPYGPLWLALAVWLAAPLPTLLGKLLAFRCMGALSYAALLAALRACGLPQRVLAVAAVNPALAQQYVADAHNDLLGIAMIVAAAALLRARRQYLGAATVVVASLIKLPFVLLALPIFAGVRPIGRRTALVVAVAAVAFGMSWFAAGPDYLRGLAVHVPAVGAVYFFNAAVTIAALAFLGLALVTARRLASAVWTIAMMSSYVAAWYVSYGLPYALARRSAVSYLLIALPFATMLIDAKFARPWTYAVVLPLTVLGCVLPRRR